MQNFVLLVDGRELPGRLMNKDEARRIYEEIVRSRRDPALLEYMGRGLYRTSVFPIPPGADRKVTMRYTQLCKRDRDVLEFSYPLSTQKFTAKPIQRLTVNISIQSKDAIKSVYCPTDDARIDRLGDHEARVSLERRDVVPSADFRLVYTLTDGALGASILSYRPSSGDDGYFLLLASPEVKAPDSKPLPKTVIFVLDRSGSMAGKKIEQARKALKSVLNNLREDDLFNIVVYDDRVESFKPELERYGSRTREEAERYVDNIREGGSTNIDSALKTALGMIRDDSRPSYILFLTDGLPTAGETQELRIADNCRQANSPARPAVLLRRRLRRQRPAARPPERRQQRDQRVCQARRGSRGPCRTVLLQADQPGAGRPPHRADGHRRESHLPARPARPLRWRPDRLGRAVPPVGQDNPEDQRESRWRAAIVRVSSGAGRQRPGQRPRVRRADLGHPPGRLPDRPD